MICRKCGKENVDGARFCAKCGSDLTTAPAEENTQNTMKDFTTKASSTVNKAASTVKKASSSDTGMVDMIITVVAGFLLFLASVVRFVSVWGYGFSLFTLGGLCVIFGIIILICGLGSIACYFLEKKELFKPLIIVGLVIVIIAFIYAEVSAYGILSIGIGFILGLIGGILGILKGLIVSKVG